MEICVAASAGFCFGVSRAVQLTERLAQEGRRVATLGPLIHNPQCVARLESMGVVTAASIEDIPAGYEVVIRSHGVSAAVEEELCRRGFVVHDATCPFVAKIHRLADRGPYRRRSARLFGSGAAAGNFEGTKCTKKSDDCGSNYISGYKMVGMHVVCKKGVYKFQNI